MTKSKLQALIESRNQSDLPEGRPNDQVRDILDRPDAEGYVQSVDPQLLFRLIRQADWDEARELVPLASPWQVQVFSDLDAWKKDRFNPSKLVPWMQALVDLAPDQKLRTVVRDLDPEIPAMLFKDGLLVGVPDEDGDPPVEFMNLNYERSLDGQYFLVFPEDEEKAALLRSLLDRLFDVDRVMAWTLLEAARWELMSQMEEEALRWRSSRLEEFGFVSRDEALEVYAYLDPVELRERIDSSDFDEKLLNRVKRTNLPVLASGPTSGFFLYEAMESIAEPETAERVLSEFVSVQNRALLADGIEPGQLEEAREVARRTLGYASLGLDFLSRSDLKAAAELLERVPLRQVFRAGFSLAWKLRKTSLELAKRPTLSLVEGERYSLANPKNAAMLSGLSRMRPMYYSGPGEMDVFQSQSQVDEVATRLAFLAFKQVWLHGIIGVNPTELAQLAYSDELLNEPPEVTYDTIFATYVAHTLIGEPPAIAPLKQDQVSKLPGILRGKPWKDDPIGFFEDQIGPVLESVPGASARFATRWIELSVNRLSDELDRVMDNPPVGMLTAFLLVTEG